MKVYQKIVPTFSFLVILAYLAIPLYAAETVAAQNKKESDKVLKFTDYNDLKGAELIKMVQMALKDSGFDPGPIDGILGPKTREAIKRLQIKNELEPTGEIDDQTLNQLFRSF